MSDTPRYFDLNEKFELCRFDSGAWSVREKQGDDRVHVQYLVGIEKMVADEMQRAIARFEQAELPEEWGDKAERMSDMHITSARDIQEWMQEEIDALRAYAARMTVERDEAREQNKGLTYRIASDGKDILAHRDKRIELESALAAANERAEKIMDKLGAVLRDNGFNDHDVAVIRSEVTAALAAARNAEGKHG